MKDYNGHTALTYVNGHGSGHGHHHSTHNDGEGRGDGEDRGDRDLDRDRDDRYLDHGEREDIASLFEPYEDGRILLRRRNDDDLNLSGDVNINVDEMNEI